MKFLFSELVKLMIHIKTQLHKLFIFLQNKFRNLKDTESYSIFIRIYKESTPVLIVTIIAEIIAGIELARLQNYFLLIPGILLIVPGLMESRGNIVSNLAQRLGSSIHMGLIGWDIGFNDEIKVNLLATIYLNVLSAIGLGIIGYIAAIILKINHITLLGFLFITILMAISVGTILTILAVFIALIANKYHMDPDNVTIPIVATLGDILTVAALGFTIDIFLLSDRIIPLI